MSHLRRLAVGSFTVADALPLGDITLNAVQRLLLPAARAVSNLIQIVVNSDEARRLTLGQTIVNRFSVSADEAAALDAAARKKPEAMAAKKKVRDSLIGLFTRLMDECGGTQ